MHANVSITPLRQDTDDGRLPVSERIRQRLVDAGHRFCMHWRGIKDDDALMRNTVMRGAFSHDASLRRDFLALLGRGGA